MTALDLESIPAALRNARDPALVRIEDAALTASRGCTTAYLQVGAGNASARHIYAKFGFLDGYAYWYRRPPAEGTTG